MKTPSIIQTKIQLKGRYKIQRIKADSGKLIQSSPWMNNLITNAGKQTYISRGDNIPLSCAVGTGNSTPSVNDTALNRVGAAGAESAANVFTEDSGTVPATYWFRFYPGQATGNISELGIYLGSPGYADFTLFSRALVRDSQGNPTTITVLSDEYLDIYWEFTLHVAGRTTGTIPFYNKGTEQSVAWVMKPAYALSWSARSGSSLEQPKINHYGSYSYLVSDVLEEPSHNDQNPSSSTSWAGPNKGAALPYVADSYYQEYEYTWLLDRGHANNINGFRLYIGCGHLWLYLPNGGVNKTNHDTLTLRFRLSVA